MPDLQRWVAAGIRADLAERDERISVAESALAELRQTGNQLRAEAAHLAERIVTWMTQAEEVQEILAGAATPTEQAVTPTEQAPTLVVAG